MIINKHSDKAIHKAFGSMHQKQSWNTTLRFLSVRMGGNNSIEKWR